MYYTRVCTLLLCLIIVINFGGSEDLENQRQTQKEIIQNCVQVLPVKNYGIDGKSLNPYFREISIKSKNNRFLGVFGFKMHIYIYGVSPSKETNVMYKLNCFYIYVNCKVALWLKNSIFNFIMNVLGFHQTKNEQTKIIKKSFEEIKSTKSWKSFDKYIKRFTSILFTLIYYVDSLAVLSNETKVLQSIYSLQFKIYYFELTYKNTDIKPNDNSLMIRENVIIMNELQGFLLTNYQEEMLFSSEGINDPKQPFGYTINVDRLNSIDSFFNHIKHFNLESHSTCLVDQMLLEGFVMYTGKVLKLINISNAILDTKVALNGKDYTSIKEIISRLVENFYDIVDVYLYQKSVLYVFVKILHIKTKLKLLTHEKPDTDDQYYYGSLKERINPESFPAVLVNYINSTTNLLKLKVWTGDVVECLSAYFKEELDSVQLSTMASELDLAEFMNELLMHKSDLACFNNIFTILQKTFDKLYEPFDTEAYRRKDIKLMTSQCGFVDDMYLICFEISISLKNAGNLNNYQYVKANHIQNSCANFNNLKRYFLLAIKSNIENSSVLKIAFDAVIILVNLKCSAEEPHYIDNYERLVYFIMTQLTDYGLKYCNALPYHLERPYFMMYNNMNLNDVGQSDLIKYRIYQSLGISVDEEEIELEQNHFDLHYLYTRFIEKSNVVAKYIDVIKFYWKGEKKNIRQIYANFSIILNSQFLYEFYDIMFKLYIAAIYFEINQYYDCVETMTYFDFNVYNNVLQNFSENYFPERMRPFVKKMKSFAKYPSISFLKPSFHKNWLNQFCGNDINEWLIVIEYNNKPSIYNINSIDIINNMTNINNELSEKAPEILLNYSLVYRD